MEAGTAIKRYYALREKFSATQSIDPIQEEDARGIIPKGLITRSRRINEGSAFLDFMTLSLRLRNAREENPDAFIAYLLWKKGRWSVRKVARYFIKNHPVRRWSRRTVQHLIDVGEIIIRNHVEDL